MSANGDNGNRILTAGERELVNSLLIIPQKIVQHQSAEGLAQAILHEIAGPQGFALKRAAYIVDNPDFDCMKGVAGFCKNDALDTSGMWDRLGSFVNDSKQASFVKEVCRFEDKSLRRRDITTKDHPEIFRIADGFGINQPQTMSWGIKHDNHGLFLFEPGDNVCVWRHALLANVVAMLGLCAI